MPICGATFSASTWCRCRAACPCPRATKRSTAGPSCRSPASSVLEPRVTEDRDHGGFRREAAAGEEAGRRADIGSRREAHVQTFPGGEELPPLRRLLVGDRQEEVRQSGVPLE